VNLCTAGTKEVKPPTSHIHGSKRGKHKREERQCLGGRWEAYGIATGGNKNLISTVKRGKRRNCSRGVGGVGKGKCEGDRNNRFAGGPVTKAQKYLFKQ